MGALHTLGCAGWVWGVPALCPRAPRAPPPTPHARVHAPPPPPQPPPPRPPPQIEVRFDIDANGILSVTATDKGTGKKQDIKITGASTLPSDEVDKMVQDAEKFAEGAQRGWVGGCGWAFPFFKGLWMCACGALSHIP